MYEATVDPPHFAAVAAHVLLHFVAASALLSFSLALVGIRVRRLLPDLTVCEFEDGLSFPSRKLTVDLRFDYFRRRTSPSLRFWCDLPRPDVFDVERFFFYRQLSSRWANSHAWKIFVQLLVLTLDFLERTISEFGYFAVVAHERASTKN
jgi:hypothetical protein